MTYETTIEDLKAAISRLRTEKSRIDGRIRALSASLRYFENEERSIAPHFGGSDTEQSRATDNNVRDKMAAILAAGGPLHRRAIYERLVEMGVQFRGQNPINNVGTYLSTDSRFENVGRGVWQLSQPHEDVADNTDDNGDDNDLKEDEEESVPW